MAAVIYFTEEGNVTEKLKEKAYRFDYRDGEIYFVDLTADTKEFDYVGDARQKGFNLPGEIDEIFQDYGKKWRGKLTAQLQEWINSKMNHEPKKKESIKEKKESVSVDEPLVLHASLVKETKNFSAYEIESDDAKGKIYLPKEFTKKRIKIRIK